MEKQAFYLKCMNDHVQYLRKIKATLKDEGDFQGTECTQCRLGKWLYNEAEQDLGEYGAEMQALYQTLLAQHQQFHDASSNALVCHCHQDEPGQYREVTEMHLLSNNLIQTLLQMDRIIQASVRAA